MELLTIQLAAGQTQTFAKAGVYIEIIDALYAVRIDFGDAQGKQCDSMVGALSGLFLEEPFSYFTVTNGAAPQTITLLIMETGRGGSRRAPGSVVMIDAIGAMAQTQGITDNTVGVTATAFVTPAANVNGVIVRASIATAFAGAVGPCNVRLIASPNMPTSLNGAVQEAMVQSAYAGTNQSVSSSNFDQRRRIPAGWGLWMVKSNGANVPVNTNITCTFEVL